MRLTPLRILLLSALLAPAAQAELRSTLDDQQSVAITIYNDNLALVKDVRNIHFQSGENQLAFREVSARMRPETAQLRSLSNPGSLRVLEQNFDFDLLTPNKLLEKNVGRTVGLIQAHPTTGAETKTSATILAASNGVVLQIGNRIETGVPHSRIVFDSVPGNLRDRPTLVSTIQSEATGAQRVELSYLTGGLSWRADYVAELSADDRAANLSGWITLTNKSGTVFRSAKLQLVAGDVNQVRDNARLARDGGVMMAKMAAPMREMAQEALFEYHLYTVGHRTTLSDNQTKQVSLLAAPTVPVRKELVFAGAPDYYGFQAGEIGQKLKAGVWVEFANKESEGLGMPLPKGVVRVYKRDKAGNAQFVGEDRIEHTARNEKVRLKLGEAFDITADKVQTDFRQIGERRPAFESAYRITLRNAKAEPVSVVVREPIPGDWTILKESHAHQKVSSRQAEWHIKIPAEGSTILEYRVRHK